MLNVVAVIEERVNTLTNSVALLTDTTERCFRAISMQMQFLQSSNGRPAARRPAPAAEPPVETTSSRKAKQRRVVGAARRAKRSPTLRPARISLKPRWRCASMWDAISRLLNLNAMAHCSREFCRRWRPDLIIRVAKLGLTVDGEWFCSNGCVEADAVRRLRDARRRDFDSRAPALRLGAVLLHQGVVTLRQLSEALEAQRTSGLRLGEQLQTLGHVTREVVLRALSAQNGISYLATVDPASVRTAPGGLTTTKCARSASCPSAKPKRSC